MAYPGPTFLNEFAVNTTLNIDEFQTECVKQGILAGVKIADDKMLLCVTEMRSKAEIDKLVGIVKQFNA